MAWSASGNVALLSGGFGGIKNQLLRNKAGDVDLMANWGVPILVKYDVFAHGLDISIVVPSSTG